MTLAQFGPVVLWMAAAAGAQVLQVMPPDPAQKAGKLLLTVALSPSDFTGQPACQVGVEVTEGPEGFVTGKTVPCRIEGNVLKAELDFRRAAAEAVRFNLTLTAKDNSGRTREYRTRGPVGLAPAAQPLELKASSIERIRLSGSALLVRLGIQASRAGSVRILVEEPDRQSALYDEIHQVSEQTRDIDFTCRPSRSAVLAVSDADSGKQLLVANLIEQPAFWKLLLWIFAWVLSGLTVLAAAGFAAWWIWKQLLPRLERHGEKIQELSKSVEQMGGSPETVGALASRVRRVETSLGLTAPAGDGEPPYSYSETVRSLIASMDRLRQDVDGTKDLPARLQALEQAMEGAVEMLDAWDPPEGLAPPAPRDPATGLPMALEEQKLLATLNYWWSSAEKPSRKELVQLLAAVDLPASFYRIVNYDRNLQDMTETRYTFEASPDEGGWLWVALPNGDAAAVPADRAMFEDSKVTLLVRRMFEGLGAIPQRFRFGTVYRACHFRPAGQAKKYSIASRGYLVLAGSSAADLPLPPAYERLAKRAAGSGADAAFADVLDKIGGALEALRPEIRRAAGPLEKPVAAGAIPAETASELAARTGEAVKGMAALEAQTRGLRESFSRLESVSRFAANLDKALESAASHAGRLSEVLDQLASRAVFLEEAREAAAPAPVLPEPPRAAAPSRPAAAAAVAAAAAPVGAPEFMAQAPPAESEPAALPADWWKEPMRTMPAAPVGPADSQDYKSRVLTLADRLSEAVEAMGASAAVSIVHLIRRDETTLMLHATSRSGAEITCEQCGLGPQEFFQLYVGVSGPRDEEISVFVPPGSFNADQHLRVRSALIKNPPAGPAVISEVIEPARLRKSGDGVYIISAKMSLRLQG